MIFLISPAPENQSKIVATILHSFAFAFGWLCATSSYEIVEEFQCSSSSAAGKRRDQRFDVHLYAPRAPPSATASYQLSFSIEYVCVIAATHDHDTVYPPWAVCDERFGSVAEYDEGLGTVDGDA